jgi:hypothetical protein
MTGLALAFVLAAGPQKQVAVKFADTPPRIDGRIEEAWARADSVSDFIQGQPDEGSEPSERTVVYVMQDKGNLYVAFRCYAARRRPVAQLYGMEEEATLYLDPMDSKQTAYFFKVYGSGLFRSGRILDDGREEDWSWDAVWYSADRLFDDRWEIEMKIPFKSMRYKAGASEWGVNFGRFITSGQEYDYWTEVHEREGGVRVSGYGRLQGVSPLAQGYYFELYPEGFLRYDEVAGDTVRTVRDVASRTRPRASLNFKWDLTPQTTMNATVLPDFAQIESDPYSFNLSRYPTLLEERRPFFVEGSEIFRLSGLGDQGVFAPLSIFYSRQIGKAVGQQPVPIISGLKLTTRSEKSSFGALGAWTDQLFDPSGALSEPRRGFAVLRGKTSLADSSNVGFLFSGTAAGSESYNYALAGDWGYGTGTHRAEVEAALSDRNGRAGWALNSGYVGFLGSFLALSALEVESDSFSVEDIGYVPWAGRKRFQTVVGPYILNRGGALRRLMVLPGLNFTQEPGSRDMSYYGTLTCSPAFRNGWDANLDAGLGRAAEADTAYQSRSLSLSVDAAQLRYGLNFGGSYGHSYNYSRGFIADNYSDWAYFTYYLAGRVALMLGTNNWWECEPEGKVLDVASVVRPKLDYRISAQMSFNVYDEIVLLTPETQFRQTRLATNRVGFLFSWNFLPKSWLYVAFNNYDVDQGQGLELSNRVGAVKLRYLVYF